LLNFHQTSTEGNCVTDYFMQSFHVFALCCFPVYFFCVVFLCTFFVLFSCVLFLCCFPVYFFCVVFLCTFLVLFSCVLFLHLPPIPYLFTVARTLDTSWGHSFKDGAMTYRLFFISECALSKMVQFLILHGVTLSKMAP
jgi:hypothetical protein